MAILISFELKLSGALALPYAQRFSLASPISLRHHRAIITAVRHQNILGWDMFLKGFISTKWEDAYHLLKDRSAPTFPISWPRFLTTTVLHTLHSIWCDRNKIIHGTSQKEKLHLERLRIVQQVQALYNDPPVLHRRFRPITQVPLSRRIQASTITLRRWVLRVKHQVEVSARLHSQSTDGQLSLRQAFANAVPRDFKKLPP